MKKFMVLYMMPADAMAEMMKNTTPEMRQKSMDGWTMWMESHKADLADMGSPLGKNMRVTADGGTMMKNDIGGYSIIQAESAEAAAEILAENPSFSDMSGTYIEVMELMMPFQV
jgi:hypothetical protein